MATESTPNTYYKSPYPFVYLAKCSQEHNKGDIVNVQNKYGKDNPSFIHNLYARGKSGVYYYSITRVDGANAQTYAKKRAERLKTAAENSVKRSDSAFERAQEGFAFRVLGEPIKIGHHSEKKHRALYERVNNAMRKSVEESEKAKEQISRAAYWESRTDDLNLSMPESLDFWEHRIKVLKNEDIDKNDKWAAKRNRVMLRHAIKQHEIAIRLWG
jgi:Domain of unknown function (DUF3560)